MSTIFQNDSTFSLRGWQRVGRRVITNQPNGVQWEFLYEGTQANLPSLATNLALKGARVTLDLKPGKSTLSALWGFDPGANPENGSSTPSNGEAPADRWDVAFEQVQESIFNHPLVVKEADQYVSPSQYKADIEAAVKNGEAYPLSSTNYPIGEKLFSKYLVRSIDYWNGFRPVIRRTRTYSQSYDLTATPERVSATVKVWTRAALIRDFAIPAGFQGRIPLDPDPAELPLPPLSTWGWRIKSYNAGYSVQTFKVEESAEWDFAAWSNDFYRIVT